MKFSPIWYLHPKKCFLLKGMQPSHFCNWKHFSCHRSMLFTTSSAADPTPIHRWKMASGNAYLLFCQQEWQTGHHATPPAIIFKAFRKPLSTRPSPGHHLRYSSQEWPEEEGCGSPWRCCWQGHPCLTQTPWTTAATQVCGCFHLPEAEEGFLPF